jgi:hypothetical protein
MTPREKYGTQFFYQSITTRQADGREFHCHDIYVCITPKHDAPTTLEYAWRVLRELAEWACEEFKGHPTSETYRITIAWSKSVLENQGHIVKIWNDLAGVREVAECATPDACAARFGPGWTPFFNWEKGLFNDEYVALFIEAVRAMESLPAPLREHAGNVTALEKHRFDESYIEFLDTQICLSARGSEWTARLTRRREALQPFCGATLFRGRVQASDAEFIVEIHPETRAVIHWEEYEYEYDHAA